MSPLFLSETSILRPLLASSPKPSQQQVPKGLAFKGPLVILIQQLCTVSGASDLRGYVDGEGEAEARTDGALGAWVAVPVGKDPLYGSKILTQSSPGLFCLPANPLSFPSPLR